MIKDKTAAKIFGNRLKGLMKERGITNAELADVFEVSEKVIERWCIMYPIRWTQQEKGIA